MSSPTSDFVRLKNTLATSLGYTIRCVCNHSHDARADTASRCRPSQHRVLVERLQQTRRSSNRRCTVDCAIIALAFPSQSVYRP